MHVSSIRSRAIRAVLCSATVVALSFGALQPVSAASLGTAASLETTCKGGFPVPVSNIPIQEQIRLNGKTPKAKCTNSAGAVKVRVLVATAVDLVIEIGTVKAYSKVYKPSKAGFFTPQVSTIIDYTASCTSAGGFSVGCEAQGGVYAIGVQERKVGASGWSNLAMKSFWTAANSNAEPAMGNGQLADGPRTGPKVATRKGYEYRAVAQVGFGMGWVGATFSTNIDGMGVIKASGITFSY